MARARGAVGTGSQRHEAIARLKKLPWAAIVVLILMLIVMLAMWGKWPHEERRPPQAPTGFIIGLQSASANSLIASAMVRSPDEADLFNRRSLQP